MAVQMNTDEKISIVTETSVPDNNICNTPAQLMWPRCACSTKQQLFNVLLAFGMLMCFISIPVMISTIRSQRVLINHLLAVEEESRSEPVSYGISDNPKSQTTEPASYGVSDDPKLQTTEPASHGISDDPELKTTMHPTDNAKVTYQRWGRVTCPSTAVLVYRGIMAGGVEQYPGGGSNYICLPDSPVYKYTVPGEQEYRAPIGATEYRLGNRDFEPMAHLHVVDATCAVCLANRNAMFVMPAQSTCPPDWTSEYSGYLMGSRSNKKRTEFICVDGNPVGRNGTANVNAARATSEIFIAETRCLGGTTGGLPCPPYWNGAELPCAVCTK